MIENNRIMILVLILYVTCAAGTIKGLIGKDGKVTDSGKHREIVEYSEERKVLSYLA